MIAAFPTYRDGDPRPALKAFLHAFRTVMQDIADHAPDHERYFPEGIARLIPAAWADLSRHFEDLVLAIEDLSNVTIARHGLAGPQLALKLALIDARNRPFEQARSYLVDGLLDLLVKLLKSIDVLLKSLIKALGADSAWEELKEAIENALENLR